MEHVKSCSENPEHAFRFSVMLRRILLTPRLKLYIQLLHVYSHRDEGEFDDDIEYLRQQWQDSSPDQYLDDAKGRFC